MVGTPQYLAPEFIVDEGVVGHDKGVDVWALGVRKGCVSCEGEG